MQIVNKTHQEDSFKKDHSYLFYLCPNGYSFEDHFLFLGAAVVLLAAARWLSLPDRHQVSGLTKPPKKLRVGGVVARPALEDGQGLSLAFGRTLHQLVDLKEKGQVLRFFVLRFNVSNYWVFTQ